MRGEPDPTTQQHESQGPAQVQDLFRRLLQEFGILDGEHSIHSLRIFSDDNRHSFTSKTELLEGGMIILSWSQNLFPAIVVFLVSGECSSGTDSKAADSTSVLGAMRYDDGLTM